MQINATSIDFVSWIAEVLRAEVTETDATYEFDMARVSSGLKTSLDKSRLTEAIEQLQKLEVSDETTLWDSRSHEVLLRDESPFPRIRMRMRDEPLVISDSDNGLRYSLTQPSDAYFLFLLMSAASLGSPRRLAGPVPLHRIAERNEANGESDAFGLLKRFFVRFITLQISSDRNRGASEFERFSTAFLFQLSYNLDSALVPQRHLDELMRTGRITDIRRANLTDIDPPRRHYLPDLVHHYQLAVAGDNPFLEYLSYYHIAEHFFEEVFNEDLVEKIKHKITQPDFSYKRKKDIGGLIKDISRSLQIRNERITFSEQEALRLTLERYVDVDSLRNQVAAYDPNLIAYYQTSKVGFANADEIDLTDHDRETLVKRLAQRIYRIRNSIVHSKESERARFVPFRDDRVLLREIPLLRFVAEQIIISTSTVIT